MKRRNFLQLMVGGLAATAAVRTWPFRVYSFPSEVKLMTPRDFDTIWASGNTGKFKELLRPGLHEAYLQYMQQVHTDEYLYGNDEVRLMLSL